MYIKCQRTIFMFKQASIISLLQYSNRWIRSNSFLILWCLLNPKIFKIIDSCISIHISMMIYSKIISLCWNGYIGSYKGVHSMSKKIIHIQESFNNIIVIVTDVWGQVTFWSAWYFWIQKYRRGTMFVAQITTVIVICMIVDQGIQWVKIMIKGPDLKKDAALGAIYPSGFHSFYFNSNL